MIPSSATCQRVNKAGDNAKLTDYRRIHDFIIKDCVLNSNSKGLYNFHFLSIPRFGLNSREMWALVRQIRGIPNSKAKSSTTMELYFPQTPCQAENINQLKKKLKCHMRKLGS